MKKTGILLLLLAIFGCTKGVKRANPHKPLEQALIYYEEGKYQKVLDVLNPVISQYIYTNVGDKAEYCLAKSYMKLKDYDNAILEFDFLVNNYPASEYRDSAYYYLVLSYYRRSPRIERDQEDLEKALKVIGDFGSEYPLSPLMEGMKEIKQKILNKLSLKMADVIKTYYNLGKYTSALLYINLLRKEYPNTDGENVSYVFESLIKKEEGLGYKDILAKVKQGNIPKSFRKYYTVLIRQD